MAGSSAGGEQGGGRCSDGAGFGATVHGRRSWWCLRAPGAALSTAVSLASSHCGSSHVGDEARRRRASAAVVSGARGRNRRRGERGWGEGLTAVAAVASSSSGKAGRRRVDDGDPRRPTMKKRSGMVFLGVLVRVGRRGG